MTAAQRIKKLEDRIAFLEAQVLALQARQTIVVVSPTPAPPIGSPTPTVQPIPTRPPHYPYVGDPPGTIGSSGTLSCSGRPS